MDSKSNGDRHLDEIYPEQGKALDPTDKPICRPSKCYAQMQKI